MKILHNSSGQGLTEYIVLLILVAVASISVVNSLGKQIRGRVDAASKKIEREVSVNAD
jgi:Flp pilus assembly pilin Flp